MTIRFYPCTAITGTGDNALKAQHGTDLQDGYVALVVMPGYAYFYILDADSGLTENIPLIVAPTTAPGAKRWIAQPSISVAGLEYGGTGLSSVTLNSYLKGNGINPLVERTYAQVKTDLDLAGSNTGDETAPRIATIITGVSAETTPLDADEFPFYKIVGNALKKVTWANIKATLPTTFHALGADTPLDADEFSFYDAVDTILKKITLVNLAAKITTCLSYSSAAKIIAGVETDEVIAPDQLAASNLLVQTGTILISPTETALPGTLPCEGGTPSRTTYARLYALIGTTFGEGDGSTTFGLPELRGEFLRGWAHGSDNDPDRTTRTDRGDGTTGDHVGTKQEDRFKLHSHASGFVATGVGTGGNYGADDGSPGNDTSSVGGNQTNPRNIAVLYCIKY
jgi:hypothetical protein